jgi:hypothetical protein
MRISAVFAFVLVALPCGAFALCGDGSIDAGEACDGSTFLQSSCEGLDMGFIGGELRCTSDCNLDLSGCVLAPPPEDVIPQKEKGDENFPKDLVGEKNKVGGEGDSVGEGALGNPPSDAQLPSIGNMVSSVASAIISFLNSRSTIGVIIFIVLCLLVLSFAYTIKKSMGGSGREEPE